MMGGGMGEYLIGGAGLSVGSTTHPFNHPYSPREFQEQALEWIHDGDTPPVAAVCAPTGGGKTDVITALGESAYKTLCIYPTNALIEDQQDEIRAAGLNPEPITAETLDGTGDDRSDELLKRVQNPHDVVVTNPDILQAIIQGSYFSPSDRLLEFFAQFDAVVYDEFHYYDPLAASGLLTQIKILSERGKHKTVDGMQLPKFLLTSATPDEAFVEYIEQDLNLDVDIIRSTIHTIDVGDKFVGDDDSLIYNMGTETDTAMERVSLARQSNSLNDLLPNVVESPPNDISRFRYPMYVKRYGEYIGECYPMIADRLNRIVQQEYDGGEPIAAVIFNSAAQSNRFYEYLHDHHPALFEDVEKDNGYDTNADRELPDEFAVLNTTSKGEVGLNYDLKQLIMECPYTSSQFIQRIGRAARKSPAKVTIYGLDDPAWPTIQSYPNFLQRVSGVLPDITNRRGQLRQLTGIRAAAALNERVETDMSINDSVFDDLTGHQSQGRWGPFFDDLNDAIREQSQASQDDRWGSIQTVDEQTTNLINLLDALRVSISSLRGQTLAHPVEYPRDGDSEETEYDLVSALSHYGVEDEPESSDERLILTDEIAPPKLIGYYAGKPCGGDGVDLTLSSKKRDMKIRDRYLEMVQRAGDLDTYNLDKSEVVDFIKTIPLSSAMIPESIDAGKTEIGVDIEYGQVTSFS